MKNEQTRIAEPTAGPPKPQVFLSFLGSRALGPLSTRARKLSLSGSLSSSLTPVRLRPQRHQCFEISRTGTIVDRKIHECHARCHVAGTSGPLTGRTPQPKERQRERTNTLVRSFDLRLKMRVTLRPSSSLDSIRQEKLLRSSKIV